MSMLAELEQSLEQYLDEQQAPVPFVVDNDDRADWALRKIAQARRSMRARAELAERQIERIQAWLESENKRDEATVERMTDLLRPYFDQLRQNGLLGKRKSYKLPHGTLKVRTSGPKYAYDEGQLLEWLKANRPEFVQQLEKPRWGDFKKVLQLVGDGAHTVVDDQGNVVDCINVASLGDETFSVDVDEGVC